MTRSSITSVTAHPVHAGYYGVQRIRLAAHAHGCFSYHLHLPEDDGDQAVPSRSDFISCAHRQRHFHVSDAESLFYFELPGRRDRALVAVVSNDDYIIATVAFKLRQLCRPLLRLADYAR